MWGCSLPRERQAAQAEILCFPYLHRDASTKERILSTMESAGGLLKGELSRPFQITHGCWLEGITMPTANEFETALPVNSHIVFISAVPLQLIGVPEIEALTQFFASRAEALRCERHIISQRLAAQKHQEFTMATQAVGMCLRTVQDVA